MADQPSVQRAGQAHARHRVCSDVAEEIVDFEREFIEAERAAYMETAIEDDDIGERMDRGRKALLAQGRSEVGPYQSPMEDGMQHFHEFYRRIMQKDIEAR